MAAPTAGEAPSRAPFGEQLRSFSRVFWIANWMELVERFAYYGVRVVLPVYMVLAISEGGPELTHVQKGSIYALWAVVQSFVPIFTGGFADRYGFKLNIAVATVLKIVGYLVMGYCIRLSELLDGVPLAEARAAGTDSVYPVFFSGAMLLALGTAVFKPGLQGLIAHEMPSKAASLGWSVFYQMVNWGGFIGPLLAGYLRVLEWEYVFLACAAGIAFNFVPLFFFAEPPRDGEEDTRTPGAVLKESLLGLLEPRLFFFTMCFAGFWLMFYQLFDILPNFIDDWVDSRAVADALGDWVPRTADGNLPQEWMINLNAGMIMLTAFLVGYATGFVRSLPAIVLGIGISAVAIYGLGMSTSGWWTLGCIALFSIGEMSASPTKMRYLASIAPRGKQGLYMGYVNMTVGIGWSVGSVVAGAMYETGGDKINLAKRYLLEHEGMSASAIAALDRGAVLDALGQQTGMDVWEIRQVLWDTYAPYEMWSVFAAIGVASLVFLLMYDHLVQAAKHNPQHSFNRNGHLWVRAALVPIVLGFSYAFYAKLQRSGDFDPAIFLLAALFVALLLASFVAQRSDSSNDHDGSSDGSPEAAVSDDNG